MDTRPQRPHLFQPNRSPPSAPLSPASTTASSPSVAVVAVPVQGAIPSSVSSVRSLAPAHVRVPLPSPVAASRGVTGILSKPKPTQPPQQTISRVCPGRWDGANMGKWCEETYVPAEGCTRCMYCEEFMRWG